MFNLIKTEFIKILKKKSFLIVTFIFILYALLTNIIYQNINNIDDVSIINTEELRNENALLDLNNPEDLKEYIANLKTIEILKYEKEYSHNTQKYLISHYLEPIISEYLEAEYIAKDSELMQKLELDKNQILDLIKKENWEYFVNQNITTYEAKLAQNLDDQTKTRYENLLALEKYRLTNQIPYDEDNYLHNALDYIKTDITEYYNLKNAQNLTKEEQDRYKYISSQMQLNKYILENKVDLNNNANLRAVLKNFASEFGLFILIYVIMIAGSIVSEEFNKGTVKFLLTKPYKRSTILTSKLLTVLLFIPLIMLMMILIELILGGMIFGFSSLKVPIIIYSAGILKSYNIFKYLILSLITTLPMYLILGLIAFAISTLMASTSAAVTVSFLIYLIGNVIANLALAYKFKLFKVLVFLHWDLSYLLNKEPSPYGFSLSESIFVLVIYSIIILCLTYAYFNKKDVKNV